MHVWIVKIEGISGVAFETIDGAIDQAREYLVYEGEDKVEIEHREMTQQAFNALKEFES